MTFFKMISFLVRIMAFATDISDISLQYEENVCVCVWGGGGGGGGS